MKIVYIAKHDSGGNDDEGSISHALNELGHEVVKLPERKPHKGANVPNVDLVLFHGLHETHKLNYFKCPKVFWYFDLVNYPDPSLAGRNSDRMAWIEQTIKNVDIGFCTDGDWVKQDNTGKLNVLRQGADARLAANWNPSLKHMRFSNSTEKIPILFTGIKRGGLTRSTFVDSMCRIYGRDFHHVERQHRDGLGAIIDRSRIVVAPDGPITDSYWSNRVYLSLGFGAFMLHPYTSELAKEYQANKEIVFYHNRKELHDLIDHYRNSPGESANIAERGWEKTLENYTYTHRVKELIRIAKERLAI